MPGNFAEESAVRAVSLISALVALALLCGAAPSRPPRRIVSLNTCADQLVVALADRAQIAGLTRWSRDRQLSAVAAQADRLPVTGGSAEEVVALRADLVIGAPGRTAAVLAPLAPRGLRLIAMPPQDSVAEIESAVATVAAAVGHPERGTALITAMRRELAAIGPPPGRGRVAAYYQRQGYLTGTGTLVDDMIARVGLVNLARRLQRPALSQLSLEEMALARPTFLIMDAEARTMADRGTMALRHPVLDAAVPPRRRLYIPQALTVCGGPAYPRAVALLAAQIRAADRH